MRNAVTRYARLVHTDAIAFDVPTSRLRKAGTSDHQRVGDCSIGEAHPGYGGRQDRLTPMW